MGLLSNHPNEYVRGSMLRFLCKVKDAEIIGPLIPSIKACLEHRHPYVRKNAALAVFHAHRLQWGGISLLIFCYEEKHSMHYAMRILHNRAILIYPGAFSMTCTALPERYGLLRTPP